MDVAAIASGGEMIAPNKKAIGQLNPGIMVCTSTPTATVVKKTSPMEASVMDLKLALKVCQLVFHDASYKRGGKKIRKITSGRRVIDGSPGINEMANPDNTNTMGKGKRYLALIMARNVTPNSKRTMISTLCIAPFIRMIDCSIYNSSENGFDEGFYVFIMPGLLA